MCREIVKNTFQKAANSTKCKDFSDRITNNRHKPNVIFSTVKAVLNHSVHPLSESSGSLCEHFGKFFADKMTTLRSQMS